MVGLLYSTLHSAGQRPLLSFRHEKKGQAKEGEHHAPVHLQGARHRHDGLADVKELPTEPHRVRDDKRASHRETQHCAEEVAFDV